ncbi:Helitron helicase [Phytophthora megakarya]|uniref:Helitron helicase n=1 Tax=Phytophthora megakarya TaxID=4795 RepID=A0A225W761_9STRA|nr:Helitron helicase [Phytophthora megakarya]
MRVRTSRNPQNAAEVGAFAYYILQVGDGRHFISPTLGPDFIKVPEDMLLDVSSSPQSNIEEQARHRLLHLNYFDAKTTDVLAINNLILEKIPGEMHEFTSVDSVDGDDELQRQEHGDLYPPEFINTISLSGMPPHKLILKIGAPVMLIRNLNTKEGLCNGTRLAIV